MKKLALLLFIALFVGFAFTSCNAEMAEKGQTVNQSILPYLEFTPDASGSGYIATIVEGARLEEVYIPSRIEINGKVFFVTSFAGFKKAEDAVNLKLIKLESASTLVSAQAVEQAVNLENIGVEDNSEGAVWGELPVVEHEGKEFVGWFDAVTGEPVHSGDVISAGTRIYPYWQDHTLVHHEGKVPTCSQPGWEEYDTCKTCDYSTYKELAKLDHALEHHAEVAASCEQAGNRDYWQCTSCKKYFSDEAGENEITEVESKALGHNIVEVAKVEAVCGKAGMEAHFECSKCHKLFADEDGCDLVARETLTIPALAHVWKRTNFSTSATCVWYECELCHETKDAAGHSWDDGVEIKAATQTESGKKKFTCSVCGTTKYEDIEPLDGACEHKWEDLETVASTCISRGWTVRECATCGITYRYKYVDPTGHTLSLVEKPATCEKDGMKAHYECSVCHELFKDKNGINETSASEVAIAALGHNWSKEFAHDEKGHWYECTREGCDAKSGEAEHKYNVKNTDALNLVSKATCTKKAVYYYLCECGVHGTLTFEAGPEPHHTLIHHEAVAAKSCSEPGNCEYWSCSACAKNFFDEACTDEITDLSETKIFIDHEASGKFVNKGEKGHQKVCANCGEAYGEVIAHDKVSWEWTYDNTGHWHRCSAKGCTYKSDFSSHSYVSYGDDGAEQVCSVCYHIKSGQESSQEGGFDIQPSKAEPRGTLEVVSSGDFKRKATFTLDTGYEMTEISWRLDGELLAGETGMTCVFDTPEYRTYKIMCVVLNNNLVFSTEIAIYGGK